MYSAEFFDSSLWWIFPLVMMLLCFFMMRGGRGSAMCGTGFGRRVRDRRQVRESAKHILEQRYARGEIDRAEFEEKRKALEGE